MSTNKCILSVDKALLLTICNNNINKNRFAGSCLLKQISSMHVIKSRYSVNLECYEFKDS